ncbi:MAG: hypothetical protein AAFW87_03990 [Pseudomonadota bacterium]
MVSIPDTSRDARGKAAQIVHDNAQIQGSGRRWILACAGAALCMAAGGLWLVPSEDSAMQLVKLFASVIMLLGGLFMFDGLNEKTDAPEVQVDPYKRQLRVYEYDAKGRSSLKASYDIDELLELSVRQRRLRARDAIGKVVIEMALGSEEEESAIRGVMPRAS